MAAKHLAFGRRADRYRHHNRKPPNAVILTEWTCPSARQFREPVGQAGIAQKGCTRSACSLIVKPSLDVP